MLTTAGVLDNFFLETRCMLLEIAATLDRYDHAAQREDKGKPVVDPRLEKVYRSLALLADSATTPDRSERLLNLFSELD